MRKATPSAAAPMKVISTRLRTDLLQRARAAALKRGVPFYQFVALALEAKCPATITFTADAGASGETDVAR